MGIPIALAKWARAVSILSTKAGPLRINHLPKGFGHWEVFSSREISVYLPHSP